MTVKITQWDNGFDLECFVNLIKTKQIDGTTCETDFIIELEGDILATGHCYVPSDKLEQWGGIAGLRMVHFQALVDDRFHAGIHATHINFGDWSCELVGTETVVITKVQPKS